MSEAPVINDTRVRRSHGRLVVQEIRQTFSRAELAAAEGLTPGQLDRLWRQELGFTPHQYWDRRRHVYACEQLRKPGASVQAVASDLGFCHLSQFSNWFTARQGESSNQYRLRPQSS